MGKNPFKVQERQMAINVAEYNKFIDFKLYTATRL